jgi:hypothetical protein
MTDPKPTDLCEQICSAISRQYGSRPMTEIVSTAGLDDLEGKHAHLETVLDQSRQHVDELKADLAQTKERLALAETKAGACEGSGTVLLGVMALLCDHLREDEDILQCVKRTVERLEAAERDRTAFLGEAAEAQADAKKAYVKLAKECAENERLRVSLARAIREERPLREALEWLRQRPCIHANLREGFGVGCSFCRADAALQGIEWHSMMEGVRVPPDRLRAELDGEKDQPPGSGSTGAPS